MVSVYGTYGYEATIGTGQINLFVTQRSGMVEYSRDCAGSTVKKHVASESGRIIVNPIEPVNLPEEVTRFLEIQFDPLLLEPSSRQTVYLTFPIEIGVFIAAQGDVHLLDIFSLNQPRYSLYGLPDWGYITRWHRSALHHEIPATDPLREGVLALEIKNDASTWVEVSRAVFDSVGMKIYYNTFVSMWAEMRVINSTVAETNFFDRPLVHGMTRSLEHYTILKIPGLHREEFLMDAGLN
ncbi:DUF432 domain-containing protein [Methanosphaerula subterraneus]|uniref:DUF432 domain-containing protein n=1 Tax=Methanosphaerula subterraneus TaxID=3350244 RepID=UPI003F8355AA